MPFAGFADVMLVLCTALVAARSLAVRRGDGRWLVAVLEFSSPSSILAFPSMACRYSESAAIGACAAVVLVLWWETAAW